MAAAAILVLAGCSSAAAKNTDADFTRTAVLDGQHVRVDLPPGKAKGLAIWFHGQGGTADTRMNEAWLNVLRVQGWAVASSDFHGNAWGNQAAVTDTTALLDWASQQADNPGKRMFVAGSMGGVNSLAYLTAGNPAPACWYGTMPVVDVATVGNVPDSAPQIKAAYNGTAPTPLNLSKLPGIRYRVIASPDDTWVPKSQNADHLVKALTAAKREVTTRPATGEHGNPSHFSDGDLRDFGASCLK